MFFKKKSLEFFSLPLFFSVYKEINFNIKITTLLFNLFNDLNYLKPHLQRNQFKILISGLYNHY